MADESAITVLNVDDDDSNRYAVSRLLRQAGYEVTEAATGEDALRLAQEKPDLIVLDVKLPDISGFEVCQRLKADPATSSISILHLSAAYQDDVSRVTGLDLGADGYLTQPVEPRVLMATVRALLRTRQVEKQLRESEEKFRALVESSPNGIVIAEGTQIVFANREMARMFACRSEDEMLGHKFTEFVVPEYRKLMLERARARENGEDVPDHYESKGLRSDGSRFDAELSVSLVPYHGRLARQAIVIDISERKRVEEELKRHHDHLEELVEERTKELRRAQEDLIRQEKLASLGKFAGHVAHELRNSLATIDSSVYVLRKKFKDTDGKMQEHLERIKTAVDNAVSTIGSLLDLTLIKEPNLTSVDLKTIAAQAVARDRVPGGVKVVCDLPEQDVGVNIDPEQFHMVFKNIVDNAVEAMEGKGTLELSVHRTEDGQAEVSVCDTGPGIPRDCLDKVFEPLFSMKTKGTGFGLSIAKTIVDKHGGKIEAKSEPGKGAILNIRLPAGPCSEDREV